MNNRDPVCEFRRKTHLDFEFLPWHTRLGVQCQKEDGVIVVILLLSFHWQHQEVPKLHTLF